MRRERVTKNDMWMVKKVEVEEEEGGEDNGRQVEAAAEEQLVKDN